MLNTIGFKYLMSVVLLFLYSRLTNTDHWQCLDDPPGELAVSVVDKLGLLLCQRVDAVAERQQRPAEWTNQR